MQPKLSGREPTCPPLETLAEEITQLRDLFQRRLFEDKAKNRLYEELHEQLALARGALSEQALTPVLRELLLLVDRVTSLTKEGDVVLESVIDELLEILERRDVRPVPACEAFDPLIHQAVGAAADNERPPGSIIKVARRGYLLGDRLLRAEQVIVVAPPERTAASKDELPSMDTDSVSHDGPIRTDL